LKTKKIIPSILFFLLCFSAFAQTARVKGVILDESGQPVPSVNIVAGNNTTITDSNGFYALTIPANHEVTIVFTHTTLKKVTVKFNLKPNEDREFYPVMLLNAEQLPTVVISKGARKRI
jgi:hypothetical protein